MACTNGDEINEVDAADVAGTDGAVEEAPSLNDMQRATDVLLPPQLTVSAGGRVDTGRQLEKKHEHHNRYSRQIPFSLRELESTGMDPLVAAHMHNANHSPINRLPNELVLQILCCLGDDPLAVLCLRRVARRFRGIINGPDILKVIDINYLSRSSGTIIEMTNQIPKGVRQELWRRIQKDGMCDDCRMRRPGGPDGPDVGCLRSPHECPVMSRSPRGLHCDGCSSGGGDHDAHPCIGRHGAVRLCEHVNISWADMEPYLSRWQQYPYEGQASLDGFSVECRDPSHDIRCRAEYPPTWPRASLKTTEAYSTSDLQFGTKLGSNSMTAYKGVVSLLFSVAKFGCDFLELGLDFSERQCTLIEFAFDKSFGG
ncbi:hypothetical protein OQA88_4864 [Cercophora sp. LCS_1]